MAAATPKSLYERLGKTGAPKIVDALTKNLKRYQVQQAPHRLQGPKLDKVKKDLVDQLCVETGGPEAGADCKYEATS